LYGCEAGSNRECGTEKDIWAKHDLVTGEWRKLHNESFIICTPHRIYSGDQIKKNEMPRHVARIWDRRGEYRVSVWRPEGKRPIGTPRHIWEDIIKMDFYDVGWRGMDWFAVA
jgi:hypothetical protein